MPLKRNNKKPHQLEFSFYKEAKTKQKTNAKVHHAKNLQEFRKKVRIDLADRINDHIIDRMADKIKVLPSKTVIQTYKRIVVEWEVKYKRLLEKLEHCGNLSKEKKLELEFGLEFLNEKRISLKEAIITYEAKKKTLTEELHELEDKVPKLKKDILDLERSIQTAERLGEYKGEDRIDFDNSMERYQKQLNECVTNIKKIETKGEKELDGLRGDIERNHDHFQATYLVLQYEIKALVR